eukprot:scaffold11425_cov43-Phaeocystis_antarctica.AAC.1
MSPDKFLAMYALDGSVAISRSVAALTRVVLLSPKPHANTVTLSPLIIAASWTAVCIGLLPGAASTVCSPSEMSSTILVAFTRLSLAKSCRAATKPSEIEVLPAADILSIPSSISGMSYDHRTRVVASFWKDTTEKRAMPSPSMYWLTSSLAKAFSPGIEPRGSGLVIE